MADKILSGAEQPDGGGGFGKFLQIALPLGLGVAAAATPGMARGASAILQTMGQFQQNRRLRDVMEMQKTQEARQSEAHRAVMEEKDYQKTQRPVKEAKGRYLGAVATGGGGHKALQVTPEGAFTSVPVNEEWVGSEPWKQSQQFQTNLQLQKQLEYLQQQTEAQRSLQKSGKELSENQPPSPQQALILRQNIIKSIEDEVNRFTNSESAPDDDQIQQYRWKLQRMHQPQVGYLEQFIPNFPKTEMDVGPPAGYVKHPKVPNAWYHPQTLKFWTP